MKKLFKKLRCWIWGHVWFCDGASATCICVECEEEF